jgi:hypothetical protein
MTTMRDKKRPHRAEPRDPNEGEGSRTAARGYDEKATAAASDKKHVEKAAEDAKRALEGPPAKG